MSNFEGILTFFLLLAERGGETDKAWFEQTPRLCGCGAFLPELSGDGVQDKHVVILGCNGEPADPQKSLL